MQSAWHPKDLDSLWSGNVSIIFISGTVRLYGHGPGVATPFSVPARNDLYLRGPPSSRDYCELQCYSIYMATEGILLNIRLFSEYTIVLTPVDKLLN